jgi:nitroreductase
MLDRLVERNRSYRRFDAGASVSAETLKELIDNGRKAASAMNLQPLKYMLSADPARNAVIFPHLKWAGYLKDWGGPAEHERPAAYIVVLHDTAIKSPSHLLWCDGGLACQIILLSAVERGLGGCIVGSADGRRLRDSLGVPERYEALLVIALGKPAEESRIEEISEGGDIRYYRDAAGVHHVPKRRLEDIIIAPA